MEFVSRSEIVAPVAEMPALERLSRIGRLVDAHVGFLHLRNRRGAGALIAAAVADRALGVGEHDEKLTTWFCEAALGDPGWAQACLAAHRLAHAQVGPSAPLSP